jgi:hypothetical protein
MSDLEKLSTPNLDIEDGRQVKSKERSTQLEVSQREYSMFLGLKLITQIEMEQMRKRSNEAEIKHARAVHDVNIILIYDVQIEETKEKFVA